MRWIRFATTVSPATPQRGHVSWAGTLAEGRAIALIRPKSRYAVLVVRPVATSTTNELCSRCGLYAPFKRVPAPRSGRQSSRILQRSADRSLVALRRLAIQRRWPATSWPAHDSGSPACVVSERVREAVTWIWALSAPLTSVSGSTFVSLCRRRPRIRCRRSVILHLDSLPRQLSK